MLYTSLNLGTSKQELKRLTTRSGLGMGFFVSGSESGNAPF